MRLLGVPIHAVTTQQCVEHVCSELGAGRGGWVVTPNLDYLRRLVRDASFRALCRDADLFVPDGMPLLWASRLRGTPLPERVAGSDLISSIAAGAARHGHRAFFLGGNPGTAERAAEVLRERHPALSVAGWHCPPMGFEDDADEVGQLVERLSGAAPQLVFVGLGSPKSEYWIQRLRPLLPTAWWVGVGISFSFLAGDVQRAPSWMQHHGLEWAHRLRQEPRRLAKRYLVHGLPFAAQLLVGAVRARVFGDRTLQN